MLLLALSTGRIPRTGNVTRPEQAQEGACRASKARLEAGVLNSYLQEVCLAVTMLFFVAFLWALVDRPAHTVCSWHETLLIRALSSAEGLACLALITLPCLTTLKSRLSCRELPTVPVVSSYYQAGHTIQRMVTSPLVSHIHSLLDTSFVFSTILLQASKRSVEQLQADNFVLRKEVDSLRIGMQALNMSRAFEAAAAVSGAVEPVSAGAAALRPSIFGGGLSATKALGGRLSGTGSTAAGSIGVGGTGSLSGSVWGSMSGSGGIRSSVALLSLTGSQGPFGASAPALPAAGGLLSGSSNGGGGGGFARASVSAAGGRASMMAAQSIYAASATPAAAKAGWQKVGVGKKSQLLLPTALSESGSGADTAVSDAQ